jgi:hypothetical protein
MNSPGDEGFLISSLRPRIAYSLEHDKILLGDDLADTSEKKISPPLFGEAEIIAMTVHQWKFCSGNRNFMPEKQTTGYKRCWYG